MSKFQNFQHDTLWTLYYSNMHPFESMTSANMVFKNAHISNGFDDALLLILYNTYIWAMTWRNQQNESASSEDSDQPGHPPSLTNVFAVRMEKAWVLSYPLSAQRRLWSDLAQADLSLRWVHTYFVGFVMSWIIYIIYVLVDIYVPIDIYFKEYGLIFE